VDTNDKLYLLQQQIIFIIKIQAHFY